MKREIKFRAWDNDRKIMCNYIPVLILGDNTIWPHGLDYFHNSQQWTYDEGLITNYKLMQFTGLHDKNGVEIYEFDRVFDPYVNKEERELFTVKYDTYMARFILEGECDTNWDETDWQIYDNIYEQKPTKEI